MRFSRGLVAGVAVASVLTTAACTSDSSDADPTPSPTTSTAAAPANLTFGVVGPAPVQRAFRATVDAWNLDPERIDVVIKSWADRATMRTDVEAGAPLPDVFMASRADLSWLLENDYTQPVDELLDERGVEFGDTYSRDALEALSADDRLQCMPYGVTPQVIYYNKRLVDFDRMRERGLDVPDADASGWSFDQFAAAAEFASRPARNTKGVQIAPTIQGLSPFIQSGGGTVFDDPEDPTSLTFSSDGSKDALERTLELLRNPQVTLDETQLSQASALRWFLRGRLGMIVGDRSLTPTLRERSNLDFDVMPMPRLDGAATVGDVTALCMSAKTESPGLSADFMLHELSADWVGLVAATGYLQPANVEVALSDDFLQPGRRPEHAAFFNSSVRSMSVPPLIDTLPKLEETVAPALQQMVYGVGVLDLDALTTQVDDESKAILDPDSVSDSPSPSDSPTPSG
ncbi:ABC transporter substrate-binding protein [Nocardioides sp. URHA0020]|uniref:ABC transporter substrate-binding protein n=1 Tax=Nocardioides sp. URHA0020 TaxID=1380392 RepID=UPI000AF33C6E|nr:extracellular solute-binding protein [Nocardioides sp. URHA0020]